MTPNTVKSASRTVRSVLCTGVAIDAVHLVVHQVVMAYAVMTQEVSMPNAVSAIGNGVLVGLIFTE